MAIRLGDDGTMDTVLVCGECGEEMRYNYDASNVDQDENNVTQDEDGGYWRVRHAGDNYSVGYATKQGAEEVLNTMLYDAWIESCIEDATEEHECEDNVKATREQQ